ncbi:MAG: restriction endonuclease subunit S [Gammaproteobacteria bacterium]|nr:restriction endonuclease subunit S [Gammaproteobacteria bacterium]
MNNNNSNWPTRPLAKCGKVLGGGTPSKQNSDYWNGTIPWITAKEMKKLELSDSELKITEKGLSESSTKLIPENSLLFVVRGSILYRHVPIAINRIPCTINQDMKAIAPDEDLLVEYLANMLLGANDELKGMVEVAGNTAGKLPTPSWSALEIPVPPIDEQRRIVARIEKLTHRAEEARKLRQKAVKKVKGLFQTELERIFLPIETDCWNEYDARDVFDIVKGQVDPREEPYASMPHVAPDVMEIGTGRLFLDKVKTAKELELKSGKYLFDSSHVLYSKIRPNLRKVALPDFDGTCSADMYPLIPNTEVVTREFLALVLLSPPFTAYAVENSDRNAMPKVNRPTMFGYRVKLPGKSEQQEIVSRLRAKQEKAEEITWLQNDVDEELAKFQSALLAKAFRGEL